MTPLLLLPLLCGVTFPLVAWWLKQGMEHARDPWGVLMVSNVVTALPFAVLALTGWGRADAPAMSAGDVALFAGVVPLPALLCGSFFFAGQVASYQSLARGDLSLAIPVQGLKVILIALFALVFLGHAAGWNLWAAALLIPVSLFFLREHPPGAREERRHRRTVVLALAAAACFAAFDTGVQAWAARFGTVRFGLWAFAFQAVLSLGLYFMPGRAARFRYARRAWVHVLAGSLGMALITIVIVWVIAASGRAAWVNILFNSRVLWAVVLPLILGRWLGTREALRPGGRRLLTGRALGAALMLVTIALAVF